MNDNEIIRLIMPVLDDTSFTREQNWYGGMAEKTENGETTSVTLTGHCFDMPYITGSITDSRAAIYIESYVSRILTDRIMEFGIDISVMCHRNMAAISPEDKLHYQALGIYGNRIDCTCQAIHAALLSMDTSGIWGIGNVSLAEKEAVKLFLPEDTFYGKTMSFTYQTYYKPVRNTR